MKTAFFNIFLFCCLLLPYHAQAADGLTPVNFKAVYAFAFSGLQLGLMGVEISQTPEHYSIATDVKLTGILKLFVQHTSHTTADGSGHDFMYPTVHYEAHWQTRKKKHYVRLDYKDGLLHGEEQIPPETHVNRPDIPLAQKKDAYDPLTAMLVMRQAAFEALKNNKAAFTFNVYEGNRLTEVDFAMLGKATIIFRDEKTPVIKVMMRRKLLAGFTASELAGFDPNEPPFYVYFTDDARFIPIKAETLFLASPITATLEKECKTGESCLLGVRD